MDARSQDKPAAEKPPKPVASPTSADRDPFVRAANEDDDGYDPYSDRPAPREPLWEADPWR